MPKGSRKKAISFSGRATKRGGGVVRAWPLKKNFFPLLAESLFFDKFVAIFGKKYGAFSPKILRRIFLFPLSLREGGGGIVGTSINPSQKPK